MAISSTSRYASSTVVTLDVGSSSRQVITAGEPQAVTFNYISHVYTGAETIDGLAYAYFGDATKWWQIAAVNPEIMNWKDIAPGTILRIPSL